jgi:hypothetical protein
MATDVVRLTEFQTRTLFELEARPPGVYNLDLLIEGNSILSTVFVSASAGGSVEVKYWEDTTGSLLGERKDLPSHPVIAAPSLNPSKITVTPFHNKPHVECTVTGGTVTFSVYATVVNSFATDLDAALIYDGETFVQTENKALPAAVLDDDDGKLYFLRAKKGVLISDPAEGGDPLYYDGVAVSTPPVQQTLASFTVAAGKVQIVNMIKVSSFIPGTWIAYQDAAIIGSGRTSAGHPDSFIEYIPRRELPTASVFTLKYLGLGPASDVHYHVMTTEIGV